MCKTQRLNQVMAGAMMCVLLGTSAKADLSWSTDAVPDHSLVRASTLQPLFASQHFADFGTPPAVVDVNGAFVQLIHTPSGTIDPAVAWGISPNGISLSSLDNSVIDTAFLGYNTQGTGHFLNPTLPGLMQNPKTTVGSFTVADRFYVRVWADPSSTDYLAGDIPMAPDAQYWDSPIFQYPDIAPQAPTPSFTFNLDSNLAPLENYAATLVVIPEPSTVMMFLMAIGMVGRRMLRRR